MRKIEFTHGAIVLLRDIFRLLGFETYCEELDKVYNEFQKAQDDLLNKGYDRSNFHNMRKDEFEKAFDDLQKIFYFLCGNITVMPPEEKEGAKNDNNSGLPKKRYRQNHIDCNGGKHCG